MATPNESDRSKSGIIAMSINLNYSCSFYRLFLPSAANENENVVSKRRDQRFCGQIDIIVFMARALNNILCCPEYLYCIDMDFDFNENVCK